MGGEESVVLRQKNKRKFDNSWMEEFNSISWSHMDNHAHAFCRLCRTDFIIRHDGKSDITQHIKIEYKFYSKIESLHAAVVAG